MKNIHKFIILSLLISIISACELYPDWESYVDYSETYPVDGEYFVRDFDMDTDTLVTDWYKVYIYNKANNPTGDSVWIDNRTGHPEGSANDYNYKYKIKTKADLENYTFNCNRAGDISGININPLDSAVTITIANSKVFVMSDDIEDAQPDSIYFEFSYYDKFGALVRTFKTMGHRKTGWEEPQNDDPM